ncbi:hypothetical protein BOTBODRAFT_28227 [Botryobasidium botryosum FD-172 SS1]|uniref:Afadin and alpha-actinin-binding-domain-containing protein n=1 Tax=Botryobasidium botryosum (strain FD-172 SS1) TaxID=930990 RepID=A0A067MV83_BOTB1|nr:hypothetical protein BOTBODRAFT_28227 [Botryobasidium botryosum FD-172 SS1]
MDPQTPAPKFVRWAFDVASPSGHSAAGTPSSPESVSSSIVFVNSQLVAHGFLRSPGIADSIERLDHDDQEAIVKCLLGMLSQRMEDMSRTEDLNTKLRTLSYDHERLNGMHKLAKEQATHAECEAEAAKSKLNATLTQLATLQASQKQTTALLSKSQSALRDTRIAAQNEIKRKEKEVERVMERWGKISNDQAKVNGVSSGLTCANLITDPAIVGPRANPALEASLAHLESERSQLTQENDMFRQILLSLANGLQSTHYALTSAGADSSSYIPEPAPITQTALFTPSITQSLADPETHALNAHKKLKELLIGVREWAEKENQAQNNNAKGKGKAVEGQEESEKKSGADEVVIERLRDEIKTLKTELEESKAAAILQSQNLIDQFANDTRFIRGSAEAGGSTDPDDMDAVSPGEIENLTAQIAEQQRVLDSERARFTEATIKLGRERAEIEAERLKFSEEKRAWALEKMLASMPETPQPETDHPAPSPRTKGEKPRKSGSGKTPRKSKIHPLKTRARASRKSDIATVEEEEEEEIIVPVSGSKLFQPSRIGTGSSIFPSVSAASSSLSVPLTVPVPAPVKSSASSISSNPFDQLLARSAEAAQSMPVIIPPPTAGSAPVSSTTPTITPPPTLAPPKVDPAPPKPIPKTPQPPSRTQQFMKKNSYAPAVPSPLSRILNIAGSPVDPDSSSESIEEQAAPPPPPPPTALPVRRPTTSRDNVSKAAATKSSATGHGSRVVGGTIRSSSSITAKQQAAGTSKIKAKPKPTRVPVGGPGKATSTIPGARVTRRSK